MMLAAELTLAGVDVAIVERRENWGAQSAHARVACTPAPSRFSISVESWIASSPRARRCRLRGSLTSRST